LHHFAPLAIQPCSGNFFHPGFRQTTSARVMPLKIRELYFYGKNYPSHCISMGYKEKIGKIFPSLEDVQEKFYATFNS